MQIRDRPPLIRRQQIEQRFNRRREPAEMQILPHHHQRNVDAPQQFAQIAVQRALFQIARPQLIVDGIQFSVRRLQFFLRRIQLFIGRLSLFVAEVDPIGWTKRRPFLDGAAG